MNIPSNLLYTKSHEWYDFGEENSVVMGITDYAQNMLGDIVFINLPNENEGINMGDVIADIESVKTAADVYCCISGMVSEVNSELVDTPELLNKDPYDNWIAKISDITDKDEFLNAEQYEEFLTVEEDR